MRKRLAFLTVLVLLVSFWMLPALAEEKKLLANGGFEQVSANGEADGWYTSAYRTQEGYTRFTITQEKAHSGLYSAKITNANLNDARYLCTVTVRPESMYRVAGYILVEDMADTGNGANFALEGLYAFSRCVYQTDGQWQYVEWYGETGENQTEIELGVRIGGYGAESQGTAYFDDLSVTEVQTLPEGVTATLWYEVNDGASAAEAAASQSAPKQSVPLFLALAVAFAALVALGKRMLLDGSPLSKPSENLWTLGFLLALLGTFGLRLYLGAVVPGYTVDMNCFAAWSLRMAGEGPWGFYAPDYFCDYPPGYMLLLWPVGLLIRAVGYADSPEVRLLIKSIPLLCDMAVALLLFSYARKRMPLKTAVFVALLFALNPAALVNGAAWGQVDTVLALLLLLTAITAMEADWRATVPLYALAVLVKPQALLFGPVGALWIILRYAAADPAQRRSQRKGFLTGFLIALGCMALIIVPFSVGQSDPWWLFKLYQKTLASYDYASLNTANLMYLLGGNWASLTGANGGEAARLAWWVPVLSGVALLLTGAVALGWLKRSRWLPKVSTEQPTEPKPSVWKTSLQALKHGTSMDSQDRKTLLGGLCLAISAVFLILATQPCTFLAYGTVWMVFAYLFAMLLLLADRDANALPFVLALMLVGVYVLGLKIHERYLFAALALLPLAYVRTGDRRLLWLTAGLSVTTFLNTAIVLDNAILFGASMGHLNLDTLALNDALCILNLLLCAYGGWIAFTGLRATPQAEPAPKRAPRTNACYRNALLTPKDARLRLTGKDYAIMAVTAVLYAALTFTNLGSFKAPQTAWVATSANEQVTFELDSAQTFKLLYYAGVSYNNFSVSVSDDGQTWSEAYPCEMREGLCYRWNYAITSVDQGAGSVRFDDSNPDNILWLTGRYLRIHADNAGLNLWEILLRDTDGNRIPVSLVAHTGAKDVLDTGKPPTNLIDEQDTLDGEPGWFNSTYFDEIYHARTAYEHLHGQSPYETTHPPLGKLIMSVGIAMFGMTPFGWRFMGALTGVLMLPALYLLAKQLTRRRDIAAFAMILFSLDLMHFTQTRIATIDSFPVLFILLATLCMVRYLMADPYAVPAGLPQGAKPRVLTAVYLRSLIPLLLSGLFMGLGIASKWIGLYAAVGLAFMFGMAVYRQFRTGLTAFDVDLTDTLNPVQQQRVQWARALTLKRILSTCLFCVLFFIAIPAGIYYLSYIPYLSPSGPVTLERIVKAQIGMFNYQSTPGLGMDHPFYSPWWQWPLILKPMWFCQDKFEPTGWASTIMCMGNPLLFYVGALSMLAVFALWLRKTVGLRGGLRFKQGDGDLTLSLVALGFLTQYLPWVLVPRSMYMYHYFASVPFIILATGLLFGRIGDARRRHWAMGVYVVLVAVFFAMFYPYASGLLTPTAWLDWLKWFPKIYY
ncbi:MAG: phospholipid carrier-dependent glycosyltransferase [Candidatus Limiplasma sp.]|nr:phospholipid carrier-dependent glycosyltransferase [Candidatus Limiplasma sp.]